MKSPLKCPRANSNGADSYHGFRVDQQGLYDWANLGHQIV